MKSIQVKSSKSGSRRDADPSPTRIILNSAGKAGTGITTGPQPQRQEIHRDFKNSMMASWSSRFSFSNC